MTQTLNVHQAQTGTVGEFRAALSAEFSKLWRLRFPRALMVFAVAIAAAGALLFLLTIEVTQGEPLAQLSEADILSTALLGVDATTIVLIILGSWIITSEYGTGMIHTSLVATPSRTALFTAKGVVSVVIAVIVGMLAMVVGVLVAELIVITQGIPSLGLGDPQLLRMMTGTLLMAPFYAVLATAAGFIVRNTGGAVILTLTVMLAPAVINMLPHTWQLILLPLFPDAAFMGITGLVGPDQAGHLTSFGSVIVLGCWLVVFLAAGFSLFSRRDA